MTLSDMAPLWRWGAFIFAFAGMVGTAQSQTVQPSPLQVSVWAFSCMACHGPEGKAEGTGLSIAGRTEEDLAGKLLAYKSGRLSATIMHQHAKGYSDDELRAIARFFATLK